MMGTFPRLSLWWRESTEANILLLLDLSAYDLYTAIRVYFVFERPSFWRRCVAGRRTLRCF